MQAAPASFPKFPVNAGGMGKFAAFLKAAQGQVCLSREQKGFTLLELVMVMALLALMMGMVVPSMYGTWHREREKASLRQLMTTLRSARSLAATKHQRVRVFLDLGAGRYQLEGSPRVEDLSRSFRLGDAHLVWEDRDTRKGYIAFYGDGSSSGGHLVVQDRGGNNQVIDVEIITGKVSLKPVKS